MKQHENMPLLPIASGQGVWLTDFDGKRYLDGVSSWWVNLFGHNEPRIKAAITQQLDQLEHVMLAGFTHQPVVELSEKLAQLTGLGHCFYASDGASATEIALKMSFHYWRNVGKPEKTKFLSLQNSYHGETIGALSVTDVAIFKDTYAPLLNASVQVPTPDARLAENNEDGQGEDAQAVALQAAQKLEDYVAQHHAQIAAFIVEPLVQCAAGMVIYHPVYLSRAREICDQYNIHLIADEIAVGFGRTGTLFACEQAGIKPDFMCLSKGITGGYLPLSVTLSTDKIYQAFYDDSVARGFLHSHSYTGNALACSAALATLAIFEQDKVLEKNQQTAHYLNQQLATWHDLPIEHLRHQGMIWAFDVKTTNPKFQQDFYREAISRGLLLRPIGNTVYFMPPYVIKTEEIDFMLQTTREVLALCV
jgi:adenosylmethionine-8-amino-7-oxononanoate aminotransferase